MIRTRRITLSNLNTWLAEKTFNSTNNNYSLRLWDEDPAAFKNIESELRLYVDEALNDARQRLRRGFTDTLSPFKDTPQDPAANYPALLHQVTLQGYLGETLGIIAIEHWGAHGRTDWQVPAFLFRFHDVEFQHLERINQKLRAGETYDPNNSKEMRPGRTGDDGLAFIRDDTGLITHVLAIEAKCLTKHSATTLSDAHAKIATTPQIPDSIRELIELLSEYDNAQAQGWREALLKFRYEGHKNATRLNSVTYVCENKPIRPPKPTWMAADAPHSSYSANHKLEGMEFHIRDLTKTINTIYRIAAK